MAALRDVFAPAVAILTLAAPLAARGGDVDERVARGEIGGLRIADPRVKAAGEEMAEIFGAFCLQNLREATALDALAGKRGAKPMAVDETIAYLRDRPGKGWHLHTASGAYRIIVEQWPRTICSVRAMTNGTNYSGGFFRVVRDYVQRKSATLAPLHQGIPPADGLKGAGGEAVSTEYEAEIADPTGAADEFFAITRLDYHGKPPPDWEQEVGKAAGLGVEFQWAHRGNFPSAQPPPPPRDKLSRPAKAEDIVRNVSIAVWNNLLLQENYYTAKNFDTLFGIPVELRPAMSGKDAAGRWKYTRIAIGNVAGGPTRPKAAAAPSASGVAVRYADDRGAIRRVEVGLSFPAEFTAGRSAVSGLLGAPCEKDENAKDEILSPVTRDAFLPEPPGAAFLSCDMDDFTYRKTVRLGFVGDRLVRLEVRAESWPGAAEPTTGAAAKPTGRR